MTDYRYFDNTEQMLCEGWPLVYSGKWKWEFKFNGIWGNNSYGPNSAGNVTLWRLAPVEEQEPKHDPQQIMINACMDRLKEVETRLNQRMVPYSKIETMEERLDALEERTRKADDVLVQHALGNYGFRLDALEARVGKRQRAKEDGLTVIDPPQQREVWMRFHSKSCISGAINWEECSPDDEGAVRFWREVVDGI